MKFDSPPSTDDILAKLKAGEIVRGNKGERVEVDGDEHYRFDPNTNRLTYYFHDGYSLEATYNNGHLSEENVIDPEGHDLDPRDDYRTIADRAQRVRNVLDHTQNSNAA